MRGVKLLIHFRTWTVAPLTFRMDKYFHLTFYCACGYISILELKSSMLVKGVPDFNTHFLGSFGDLNRLLPHGDTNYHQCREKVQSWAILSNFGRDKTTKNKCGSRLIQMWSKYLSNFTNMHFDIRGYDIREAGSITIYLPTVQK